jgi:hypothetical protein
MIPEMYINPSIVAMSITLMLALLTVGGIIWKIAGEIANLRSDIRVMDTKLDSHIENCEGKMIPRKRLP